MIVILSIVISFDATTKNVVFFFLVTYLSFFELIVKYWFSFFTPNAYINFNTFNAVISSILILIIIITAGY